MMLSKEELAEWRRCSVGIERKIYSGEDIIELLDHIAEQDKRIAELEAAAREVVLGEMECMCKKDRRCDYCQAVVELRNLLEGAK